MFLIFKAFKSEYLKILKSIPEGHPYRPLNILAKTNNPCCISLLAAISYNISVDFSKQNLGYDIELRSPYPRRKKRQLLFQDHDIYETFLKYQLKISKEKKSIKDHNWPIIFEESSPLSEQSFYAPIIATQKACVDCHLSHIREQQDDILLDSNFEDLMNATIGGSLIIPPEPQIDNILGIFIIRMQKENGGW